MQTEMLNLLQNKLKQAFILIALLGCLPITDAQVPDEQLLAGSAWLIKGDYQRAMESLSLAITRNNADDQLFIKRGIALLQLRDTDAAIADFSEANLINPQVADLWLAKAYTQTGDTEKAFEFLRNHLKSSFRISEDSIKKDPAFNKLKKDKEWIDLWNQEWYDDAEKILEDVKYYTGRNQLETAITMLDEGIAKHQGRKSLLMARSNVLMRQANYASAAGDLTMIINADKRDKAAYMQRGYAYLQAQRYKDAVADFTRALRIDPADFDGYLHRASAYAGMADYSPAIKDMKVYMKYFEDDLDAVYQCGEYYFAAGDYINALKLFNRNLTEDPNNPLYYKARGKAYLKTSTYRYAISDLTMSLDLNPNDAETWMYHGLAAIQSGDAQKGCSSLRKAQKLGSAEAVKHLMENCE